MSRRGRGGGAWSKIVFHRAMKKIIKILFFLLTSRIWFSIITKPSQERGRTGEHSSAGRAHALQAWGHRFEPCCSHHFDPRNPPGLPGSVVQLVRTPACHAGGRGFKSLPSRHFLFLLSVSKEICLCSSVGRAGD